MLKFLFLLFLLLSFPSSVWTAPQAESGEKAQSSVFPKIYFDAQSTSFQKDGSEQVFEGQVVGFIAHSLIFSDKLRLDRKQNILEASGHVLLVSADSVLGGESLIYHLDTGDLTLTKAFALTRASAKTEALMRDWFGKSLEEIEAELARKNQLRLVQQKKIRIKREYAKKSTSGDYAQDLTSQYEILIEEEALIKTQENPTLAKMNSTRRNILKARRQVWDESRSEGSPLLPALSFKGYVKLTGDRIDRDGTYHVKGDNISLTPCKCEEDSSPAWSLRADTLDAYVEGYADLMNPMVEVYGMPILYLPFLRIPVKNERQSGFLLPNFSTSSSNGSTYSQPLYFALNPKTDSTFTVDWVEKRGVRLGLELRRQEREHSGWDIESEILRDSLWSDQKKDRAAVLEAYRAGLERAQLKENSDTSPPSRRAFLPQEYRSADLEEPSWWKRAGYESCLLEKNREVCDKELEMSLGMPNNLWRHKTEWSGQNFFTPRLSFVSSGRLLSDHRYDQDRYVLSFDESLNLLNQPHLFSKSNWQFHLDGKNFYLGYGGRFGDKMTGHKRFGGHQLPSHFKLQTRYISLFENSSPRPVYAGLALNVKQIKLYPEDNHKVPLPDPNILNLELGSGQWSQAKLSLLSPLVVEQAFRLSTFADLDVRAIDSDLRPRNGFSKADFDSFSTLSSNSSSSFSSLRSARIGLDFHLPLDGYFNFARQFNPEESDDENVISSERRLQHKMNWNVTLSLKPSVVQQGPYGQLYNAYKIDDSHSEISTIPGAERLSYFEGDEITARNSDLIPEEEKMYAHKKIILSTSHDWSLMTQVAKLLPFLGKEDSLGAAPPLKNPSSSARASAELNHHKNRLQAYEQRAKEEPWLEHHVSKETRDLSTPAHFDASIAYDWILEQKRKEQQEANRSNPEERVTLVQPWSPFRSQLNLALVGVRLDISSKYNLYDKIMNGLTFGLFFPPVLGSDLGTTYSIEREVSDDRNGGLLVTETKTRRYLLGTRLISPLYIKGEYAERVKENILLKPEQYASIAVDFSSSSECWGWVFFWKKDFADVGWKGTYYLSLIVQFFNYRRDYGNLVTKMNP
ncbi:MAG: LPS-assembly protein LptD [Oligoflexales bacterium]|nr:LPS-assembly protein LptD [Oligoflexales bacterium]